jgi:hypothetical protein
MKLNFNETARGAVPSILFFAFFSPRYPVQWLQIFAERLAF